MIVKTTIFLYYSICIIPVDLRRSMLQEEFYNITSSGTVTWRRKKIRLMNTSAKGRQAAYF